jgi:hypothetical protein
MRERTLSSTAGQKGRELLPSSGWWQFPALPCKFPIWKNTYHKWKQIILVANFLFGLRVKEITNKTFTV